MLGYDHNSFWDQTPRTLSLTFSANEDRRIREHNERAWSAWHIAALQRTKKMPALRSLYAKPRMLTVDEKTNALKNWAIATGGKIVYKKAESNG